jgi:rRNA maturation protein Nop10
MPYLLCPRCGLRLYSAARYSSTDNCPRCLGRVGVDIPPHEEPRPQALRIRRDRSGGRGR